MKLLKKEWLFFIFLALFFILTVYHKPTPNELISAIDFPTIRALAVLLLITTALRESKFFEYLAIKFIKRFKTEKTLSFSFIFLTMFLSMFLTNDITLFIIVPLTLAFSNQLKNDLTKLVIFEAIAVNVGSALTPFGNPQNLFLFRQMDISQIEFVSKMALIVIPQIFLLIIFTLISFKSKPLQVKIQKEVKTDRILLFSSILLFLIFIASLELSLVRYALIITVAFYLLAYKKVFLKFDYFLIMTFILMFMDFSMLAKLDFIKSLMSTIKFDFLNTFNASITLSQIISNVPASIFMTHFSKEYLAIAYGVNVAGNGLLIASLANIIALRFLNNPKVYVTFHKYSIPFFILSYILIFLII